MFYQGGPIDHYTHDPGKVDKIISESEYNKAYSPGMDLSHFRILNNKFLNKDTDVVTEQAPLIILDRNLDVCTTKNGKGKKHTIQIDRTMHLLRKGEE